jgi:hypothetical protein
VLGFGHEPPVNAGSALSCTVPFTEVSITLSNSIIILPLRAALALLGNTDVTTGGVLSGTTKSTLYPLEPADPVWLKVIFIPLTVAAGVAEKMYPAVGLKLRNSLYVSPTTKLCEAPTISLLLRRRHWSTSTVYWLGSPEVAVKLGVAPPTGAVIVAEAVAIAWLTVTLCPIVVVFASTTLLLALTSTQSGARMSDILRVAP